MLKSVDPIPVEPRKKEYISGGFNRTLSPLLKNALEVLTRTSDDLSKEFTDKVYDDMLRDPAVAASVDILRGLITSEPIRVIPTVQDKKAEGYEEAVKAAKFVEDCFSRMSRSPKDIVWEALEAIPYGSSLSEVVYEDGTYEGRPVLRIRDIKTRSRSKYYLVVDRFYNLLGAAPVESGSQAVGVYTGSEKYDPEKLVPRSKFLLLTFSGRNGDPRGSSLIRPAYNAYYLKTQVWPAYLKYLVQFASPSLVGFTPEGAEDIEEVDEAGNLKLNADGSVATITAEEDMLTTLLGFQSGTVAVLKGGSRLEPIKTEGHGEAYTAAVDLFDRQIAMSILKTHRTLLEAKHSSKADSESAADITDVFVASLRETVSAAITRDVVRVLIEINFGEDYAARFAPTVTLQSMPRQDFSKSAEAISKLWAAKYLHASQIAETDALIGLPERDLEAFLAEAEEEAESRRFEQEERAKLLNPGVGTTKPSEEDE